MFSALKEIGQTPLGVINFALSIRPTSGEEKFLKLDERVSVAVEKFDSFVLFIMEKEGIRKTHGSRTTLDLSALAARR